MVVPRDTLGAVLVFELGLSPTRAAILARLYRAVDSYLSVRDLNDATAEASRIYDPNNPRDDRTLYVHVCHLRNQYGRDVILSHQGMGYALGPTGVALVKEALRAREERIAKRMAG